MKTFKKILLVCLAVFCLVGCDYSTKRIAKYELKDKPVQSYLGGNLQLHYAENPGGMLGVGDNLSESMRFIVFRIFIAVMLSFLFIYIITGKARNKLLFTALILILSGGTGNLIDRIMNHGKVTDFIIMGISSTHTGIFNIADFYVTTGVVLIIISTLFTKKKPLISDLHL